MNEYTFDEFIRVMETIANSVFGNKKTKEKALGALLLSHRLFAINYMNDIKFRRMTEALPEFVKRYDT